MRFSFQRKNVYQSTVWLTLISFCYWKSLRAQVQTTASFLFRHPPFVLKDEKKPEGRAWNWAAECLYLHLWPVCHCSVHFLQVLGRRGCFNLFVQFVPCSLHRNAFVCFSPFEVNGGAGWIYGTSSVVLYKSITETSLY